MLAALYTKLKSAKFYVNAGCGQSANLIPANISGYTVHLVLQYMRLHVYQLVYVYNHV